MIPLLLALLAPALAADPVGGAAAEEGPIHVVVAPLTVTQGETADLQIAFKMDGDARVYRDAVQVTATDAAGLTVAAAVLPNGARQPDPAGGDVRELWAKKATVKVPVTAPADAAIGPVTMHLSLKLQGCTPGMALPAEERMIDVPVQVVAPPPPKGKK